MALGEAFFIIVVLSAISSWVAAAMYGFRRGAAKGFLLFIIHFLSAASVVYMLWLFIVYPTIDCTGRLCGLEHMVLWSVISIIIMIVWPLILVAFFKRKWPRQEKVVKKREDILDDDIA